MAEGLTFDTYALDRDGQNGIYAIGADPETQKGVVQEIAVVFDYELGDRPSVEKLGELLKQGAPKKKLQENIGRIQEALGTDEDAVAIARGWVERSGLLVPVQRSYVTAEKSDNIIDLAVITGGVRNWIHRRAVRLVELDGEVGVRNALLVAGNRVMDTAEGPDVEEGMTEADYMEGVILPNLTAGDRGTPTTMVAADTDVGDEVMMAGVEAILEQDLVDLESERIAVVSNAGAWVQNAGQFRRAVKAAVDITFDHEGDRLVAVSDGFQLGTGTEPPSTHQNPFSAAGQILRNAQELTRQAAFY